MIRRIAEQFDPEKIILFGSHARGEAGPDSDADLIVVMRVAGSRRKKAAEIHQALWGIILPVDVLVYTPEQIEKYKDVFGGVIYPACGKGRSSMNGPPENLSLVRQWIQKAENDLRTADTP